MRFHLLSLAITALTCLTSAAYLPDQSHKVENHLNARSGDNDVCNNVKVIVTLLEAHKATPFCSSFLGTATVTASTETKTETTVTTTTTTISFSTGTTWTTFPTSTHTFFRPITVETTFIRTTTAPTTVTTTTTVPYPETLTVTSWYTSTAENPARIKRSPPAAPLNARGGGGAGDQNIPPYLKHYPTPSISQACSCYPHVTTPPTVTVTPTTTTTTTSISVSSYTTTWTQTFERRVIIYTTSYYTYLVPGVSTSWTTTTETATTTAAGTYSTTTTVETPLPTECVNIGSGGKLYDTLIMGPYLHGMYGYDIDATTGEERRSICCADCWQAKDCIYWRVVATTFCRVYYRTQQVDGSPSTDQCPLGSGSETLQDPITDPADDNPGFGKGPCL